MGVIKFAIVDCETTGLGNDDEPISIGIVAGEVDDQKGLLVGDLIEWEGEQEPSVPISDGAFKIHGRTVESLQGKKFDVKTLNKLLSGADILVAHNAEFDARMLKKVFKGTAKAKWRCSYRQWVWGWDGMDNCKLDTVCKHFDIHRQDTHSALADARALADALLRHSGKTERSMTYMKKLINYYDFDLEYREKREQYFKAQENWNRANEYCESLIEEKKRMIWRTRLNILIVVVFTLSMASYCFK